MRSVVQPIAFLGRLLWGAPLLLLGCGLTESGDPDLPGHGSGPPRGVSPPMPCVLRVVLPSAPATDPASESPLDAPPEEDRGSASTLTVDVERVRAAIESALGSQRLCTRWEVVATPAPGEGPGDPAGPGEADVVVKIEPEAPPTYRFIHRNGWFIPNTLLWFLAGFPSFWIPDRVYVVRWDVTFRIHGITGNSGPQSVRQILDTEHSVSLADQGWTARVLYTPPAFYEGPDLARSLSPIAEEWLVRQLVALLETEAGRPRPLAGPVAVGVEAPANLSTVPAGQVPLRVVIETPTLLERLRILVDGSPEIELHPLNMVRAARGPASRTSERPYIYVIERLLGPLDPGTHTVRILVLRSRESALGREAVSSGPSRWSATRTIQFDVEADATTEAPGVDRGLDR